MCFVGGGRQTPTPIKNPKQITHRIWKSSILGRHGQLWGPANQGALFWAGAFDSLLRLTARRWDALADGG